MGDPTGSCNYAGTKTIVEVPAEAGSNSQGKQNDAECQVGLRFWHTVELYHGIEKDAPGIDGPKRDLHEEGGNSDDPTVGKGRWN